MVGVCTLAHLAVLAVAGVVRAHVRAAGLVLAEEAVLDPHDLTWTSQRRAVRACHSCDGSGA